MALKIIGAGLPRTGTNSLKRSLEMLGISKCYHMKTLLTNPDQLHFWLQLEETGSTDWDTLYNGFQGSVDFPCYPFYKEHLKRYPDAKVILTVRDFDSWYKSVKSTIWTAGPQNLGEKLMMLGRMLTNPRVKRVIMCIKFVKRMLWEKQFQGRFEDASYAEEVFNRHTEVYDVRDGWGPLCEFLEVTAPTEPLPHLNKKENFKTMLQGLIKTGVMEED